MKYLLTFCLGILCLQSFSQNCSEVLGARETYSNQGKSYNYLSFQRFFCDKQWSSYEEARSAGLQFGINLDGLPIQINGKKRKEQWSTYRREICESINLETIDQQTWNIQIDNIGKGVVEAWEKCISSLGLHFWVELNRYDPNVIAIKGKFLNEGKPHYTRANGSLLGLSNLKNIEGDIIKKRKKISSKGFNIQAVRKDSSAFSISLNTNNGNRTVEIPSISKVPCYLLDNFMETTIKIGGGEAQGDVLYGNYKPIIADINNDRLQDLIFCGNQKTFVHMGIDKCKVETKSRRETDHGHPKRFVGYTPSLKYINDDDFLDLVWTGRPAVFVIFGTKDGYFQNEDQVK